MAAMRLTSIGRATWPFLSGSDAPPEPKQKKNWRWCSILMRRLFPIGMRKRKTTSVTSRWTGMIGSIRSRHARSPGRPDFRKEAAAQGVSVFFITGRGESQREATTADNLKSAGSGLALREPHPKEQSVTEYKSGQRKKIVDGISHHP